MRHESVIQSGHLSSIVEFRERLSCGTRHVVDAIVMAGLLVAATAVGMGFDSLGMVLRQSLWSTCSPYS